MRRPSAPVGLLVSAMVVAGAAASVGHLGDGAPAVAQDDAPDLQVLAPRDLTHDQTFDGTIGHATSMPFITARGGTVTSLAATGAALQAGDIVFRVDDIPSVYLPGTVPAWRDLSMSSPPGPDIAQLEAGLIAAGWDEPHEIVADSTFDAGTYAAVVRMQTALGIDLTGTVALGQVVFAPPATSVGLPATSVGALVNPGQKLLGTISDGLTATIALTADVQVQIRLGQRVVVTLPDYSTTPGTVTAIATETDEDTESTSVVATITVDRPADGQAHGVVDQAPVRVRVTQELAQGVLVVPAGAITAHVDGTYRAVKQGSGGSLVEVPIQLGVAAGGWVEVRGGDLRAGDAVVLPARA